MTGPCDASARRLAPASPLGGKAGGRRRRAPWKPCSSPSRSRPAASSPCRPAPTPNSPRATGSPFAATALQLSRGRPAARRGLRHRHARGLAGRLAPRALVARGGRHRLRVLRGLDGPAVSAPRRGGLGRPFHRRPDAGLARPRRLRHARRGRDRLPDERRLGTLAVLAGAASDRPRAEWRRARPLPAQLGLDRLGPARRRRAAGAGRGERPSARRTSAAPFAVGAVSFFVATFAMSAALLAGAGMARRRARTSAGVAGHALVGLARWLRGARPT